jgi:hypothetical protein
MNGSYVQAMICSVLLYLSLITGILLAFEGALRVPFNSWRVHHRLMVSRLEFRVERMPEKWLRQALVITTGWDLSPRAFLYLLIGLFLMAFLIGINTFAPLGTLMVSAMIALLPCLLLWIRLSTIRRKGSHEGERLVSEFLRQYRLSNYNIYETLERVVSVHMDIKVTKKLLYKLLIELRDTGNPKKIKGATETFAYGINTNWGLMLAHNIEIAANRGTNVSYAIEDILIQLREARTIAEDRKRLNSEASRMTYFMVPFIYVTTVALAVRYLELPFLRFIRNQFYTPEGLFFFLLILFFFVANISLLSLVTNQRFDF